MVRPVRPPVFRQGTGFFMQKIPRRRNRKRWSRKDVVVFYRSGTARWCVMKASSAACINCGCQRRHSAKYYAKQPKSNRYDEGENEVEAYKQKSQRFITELSGTATADVSSELHHPYGWHLMTSSLIRYQPEIKKKTYLRERGDWLIDILTAKWMFDGWYRWSKSGGTCVLCRACRVGKTLTAEVYSEISSVLCTVCIPTTGAHVGEWKKL